MYKKKKLEFWFLWLTVVMAEVGFVMVSVSAFQAAKKFL